MDTSKENLRKKLYDQEGELNIFDMLVDDHGHPEIGAYQFEEGCYIGTVNLAYEPHGNGSMYQYTGEFDDDGYPLIEKFPFVDGDWYNGECLDR